MCISFLASAFISFRSHLILSSAWVVPEVNGNERQKKKTAGGAVSGVAARSALQSKYHVTASLRKPNA
jgi:hypothetical protein